MLTNFEYLKHNSNYVSFIPACIEAEKLMNVSYSATATYARRALELAVRWVYANDSELKLPYQENLASLIYNYDFKSILEPELITHLAYIQKLGNKAVHSPTPVRRDEAVLALKNLFEFISWIDYCYSINYSEKKFDESILGDNEKLTNTQKEREEFFELLSKKDRKLEEMMKENEKLREENSETRKSNQNSRIYNYEKISEEKTRKLYIDLNLNSNGWEIGKDCLEEVETHSMDNESHHGFVDYVLYGDNGKPLAVVEAKRTSKSPRIGKVQAQMYADALEKDTGVRPVIFYTNGIDYYIWDDGNKPERKVSGIYAKKDLENIMFKRNHRESLLNVVINDDITNRPYQKEAITRVMEAFERGQNSALLVMATGSGKTRTAASIVDILTKKNFAKNILFLADRTALVKQAKMSFKEHLPNLSLCNLSNSKDDVNSRMIFSTYPTMMNAIDNTKTKDEKRLFTTGHFDLIILDESHRSIYKKYQDIFEYFDANLLGLTATPVNEIDRNTYRVFELEDNNPTFAYELEEAIKDGYLVDYKIKTCTLKLIEEGIKYAELSDEDKERFEETFDNFEDIPSEKINRTLFNKDTVDIVLQELMTSGIKIENGTKLGKTIIFATNQRHADFIVERFNKLYPEYKGHFAQAIYHKINYVENLIDKFKDKDSMPQIAVSVDMLDTGIDVPELVNLVFFKKVRSKAKFWQMIGRGTRLCKDLFGPGQDKENFLIFDYYKNFEFFSVKGNFSEGHIQKSLTEKLFNIKIDLIKILERMEYQEEDYIRHRKILIFEILDEISKINRIRWDVEKRLHHIDKFSDKRAFESLSEEDVRNLKNEIAPLIISVEEDQLAKSFDFLMYTIELAYLEGRKVTRPKTRLIKAASQLETKGSIPIVRENKYIINKVQTDEFWEEADIFDYETVREALRDLIKLIDRESQTFYDTDFTDELLEVGEINSIYDVNDLDNYRKNVEHYLKNHLEELPIFKLRNNKFLTKQDVEYFEKLLWEELGNKNEYEKVYGDKPLTELVASIVGMDRAAAEEAFSRFLSNENLNSNQIDFVKTVVDYIVKNGSLDKRVLQEFPFNKNGSVTIIFKQNLGMVKDIISTIDVLNSRLVVGA